MTLAPGSLLGRTNGEAAQSGALKPSHVIHRLANQCAECGTGISCSSVTDKRAHGYSCPTVLLQYYMLYSYSMLGAILDDTMHFNTSGGEKNHWITEFMPWSHVAEISISLSGLISSSPHFCLLKEEVIEKPVMHCWRGISLLKDRFYCQIPQSRLLWLHSSIFPMCPHFRRLKRIPLCVWWPVHMWAGAFYSAVSAIVEHWRGKN